jgi:RNA polymerase sigma-70 factor (ECF subfamily)
MLKQPREEQQGRRDRLSSAVGTGQLRGESVPRSPQAAESATSDEQLFAAYQAAGDAQVFAELVSRYQRELYNYLRRFLGDASLAEDVFQATFLQVHVKRQAFEAGRKFRPWLYTIATNQAIDAQRRNRRHRRLSLDQSRQSSSEDLGSLLDVVAAQDLDPVLSAQQGEQADWIRNEVEGLPEPLKRAVNLVYFRGMKYRDAAKILSIPVGTVKSRLHAALQRIGQAWQDMPTAPRN